MNTAVSTSSDAPVAAAIAAALRGAPAAAGNRPVADATPALTTAASAPETRFTWTGSPWSLLGPCLFNGFMTLVTLGVYSFWGRTEIRRRMWAFVRLEGEPLVYHGTGMELFKGFMAALVVVLLPLFIIGMALVITYGQGSSGWAIYQFALFVIVYPVLKALAQYRARRYRLARTSWRGIRGSMTGSASEFAFLSWATSLLYPLTLAWIAPWRALYIQRFLIGDTMLGDRHLRLGGSTGKLYLRFALLWFASIVLYLGAATAIVKLAGGYGSVIKVPADITKLPAALWLEIAAVLLAAVFIWSLISSFYRAALYNMTANATEIRPVDGSGLPTLHFKLTTRGPQLIWLFVTNQLLTYGSLFVLRPIATARSMRYFIQQLSIVGPFDPATLRQNPHAARSEGEGLAQAFDFDAF